MKILEQNIHEKKFKIHKKCVVRIYSIAPKFLSWSNIPWLPKMQTFRENEQKNKQDPVQLMQLLCKYEIK